MAHPLARLLAGAFKAPAAPHRDPFRKQREQAKACADDWGVEIERLRDGGFNVWPPKDWPADVPDPLGGDHYCNDWGGVFEAVCAYRPHV